MSGEADSIASIVLEEFGRLPAKRRPSVRDNGLHEWVPLSGIVAKGRNESLTCLSLSTGMKCLPSSKLPRANGIMLHDWHAEVLAVRSFNHFVLEECRNLAISGKPSDFLRLRGDDELEMTGDGWHGQPFAWREDVTLHMYCSEAPCGDASMELTMAAQEDASPWEIPSTHAETQASLKDASLPGRAYFSQLGVVRRKPARGDAPPTLSKSCSDKLALKQCTSLLSSLTSLLVSPKSVYLHSLILPESHHSPAACTRSFSPEGRMRALDGRQWSAGYSFTPFQVRATSREFDYSRRAVESHAEKIVASNLAIAWSRHGLEEGLVGGVLQGRKQFDSRGASLVSRKSMWALAIEVAGLLDLGYVELQKLLQEKTYQNLKEGRLLAARREVKSEARSLALKGWVRNTGDEGFGLGPP